jgi:hypothetical protein
MRRRVRVVAIRHARSLLHQVLRGTVPIWIPIPIVILEVVDSNHERRARRAIIIPCIASLLRARTSEWIGVVTVEGQERPVRHGAIGGNRVRAGSQVAEAIPVEIWVPECKLHVLVDASVTVVVLAIEDLGLGSVDRRIGIVAIEARGRDTWPARAARDRSLGVSVQIAVGIHEATHRNLLIHPAITVVVATITYLGDVRVRAASRVVAVFPARRRASLRGVAAARVDEAIAVEVSVAEGAWVAILVMPVEVADLGVVGRAGGVRVVAIVAATFERHVTITVRVGIRASAATSLGTVIARDA